MNAKKLLWLALTAILTLVVLVGVAGAGFRMGLMQNVNGTTFPFLGRGRGFDQDSRMQGFNQGNVPNGNPQPNQGNIPNGNPQAQGFEQWHGYGNPNMSGFGQGRGLGRGLGRGFERGFGGGFGRGRGGFFSPLFGLIHLVILGALIWLGYKYAVKSGWRITRVTQPASVASATPSVDEEKPEA